MLEKKNFRFYLRYFILLLVSFLYIPQLCFFLKSTNVIFEDLKNNEYLSRSGFCRSSSFIQLLFALHFDEYFNRLYFYRARKSIFRHFFFSRYSPDFYIPSATELSYPIQYSHPYSTILNAKKIGSNFSFKHLTTIGNINDDDSLRPVIGDNVSLGANVTIIGDICIGDNVIVGAGTVIVKDVPSNCVVVGNPSKIIRKI